MRLLFAGAEDYAEIRIPAIALPTFFPKSPSVNRTCFAAFIIADLLYLYTRKLVFYCADRIAFCLFRSLSSRFSLRLSCPEDSAAAQGDDQPRRRFPFVGSFDFCGHEQRHGRVLSRDDYRAVLRLARVRYCGDHFLRQGQRLDQGVVFMRNLGNLRPFRRCGNQFDFEGTVFLLPQSCGLEPSLSQREYHFRHLADVVFVRAWAVYRRVGAREEKRRLTRTRKSKF